MHLFIRQFYTLHNSGRYEEKNNKIARLNEIEYDILLKLN